MALVWQQRADGVRYEVRSAGNSLRLYTNGVLHTQYNPTRTWTGSVWDLLTLPSLLLPPERIRRVLVLGVGGGAAIRQLLDFFPHAQVTGIELNPVHVQLATRYFGLQDPRVHLVCDNAVTWLALYDGEPFDLVIDDLFGDRDGVPCRAVPVDADWLDLLASNLDSCGLLTINFAGARDVSRAPWRSLFNPGARRARFGTVLSLSTPGCENRVLALLPPDARRDVRQALVSHEAGSARTARDVPRFSCRALA